MLQLADWQKSAGLDVTIWCKAGSPIFEEATRRGLKVLTAWMPTRRALLGLPLLAFTIRRQHFTHLQIHWSGGVMSFAGIKFLSHVKVFYHPHMFIDYRKQDFFHRLAYAQLDLVFTAGERAKKSYLSNLPLKESQIHLIPYGLELENSAKVRAQAPAQEKWNLPAAGFYMGYFGRIDRQKGVKEFLQASLPLLKKYPHLHVLVVGDVTRGEADALHYQQELEDFIRSAELTAEEASRFHRYPHQKEFLSLMSCLNILVMPSYQETYSLLIINAFALNVPVLSTKEGGSPDLIGEREERGWLVPARNEHALQQKLIEILETPSSVAEKKMSLLHYVESCHDARVVSEQYLKVYSQQS
jgi:glycosyltransferase involved in cell wall biosynthesis